MVQFDIDQHIDKSAGIAFDDFRDKLRQVFLAAKDQPDGWSIQGLGMLRLYMSDDETWRLHIWDKDAVYKPKPSPIHTHPWDLESTIIGGRITNQKWLEIGSKVEGAVPLKYSVQAIKCGEGGCVLGEPQETWLTRGPVRSLGPKDFYAMQKDEIHETIFFDGTVTLLHRSFIGNRDIARVFWPAGREFISAHGRTATRDEVARATEKAIKRLEQN